MTHDFKPHDDTLPEALRFELRALRRDVPPAPDLWPSIASRIATTPQGMSSTPRRFRFALPAIAASVALALGIAWQLRPIDTPLRAPVDPHTQLIAKEAEAMTREYQAALRVIDANARAQSATTSPELQVLDHSAAQIRTALSHDPNARFLLDRLQRTYTRRLELTQRMATRHTLAS